MRAKVRVTEEGVVVPKDFFTGVEEVEIRKENNFVLVVPISDDPILQLGAHPVRDEIADASENHDQYIYS